MSISNVNTQSWIRPPESLESLGKCLFRMIDRGNLESFLCFHEWDNQLFVFPPIPEARERELLDDLLVAAWRERPREVFTRLFTMMGIPTGLDGVAVNWHFISGGMDTRPVGAYAYVENVARDDPDVRPPDTHAINLFLSELIRCHNTIRKFSELANESDYLFSTINRVGCLLLHRPKRSQVLAALLELAMYLGRAEVGLLMVQRDGEFRPEVEMGLDPDLVMGLRFLPERDSLVDRLCMTQKALIIDNVSGPTVDVPRPYNVRVRGLASIPLVTESGIVGLICLASGEEDTEISTNQLEALQTIAAVVAIAVENDRLRDAVAGEGVAEPGLGAAPTVDLDTLRTLFQNVEDGVIFANGQGRILYSNLRASKLLGLRKKGKEIVPGEPGGPARTVHWLRDLWLEGQPCRAVKVPYPVVHDARLEASIDRVPGTSPESRGPVWLTLLRTEHGGRMLGGLFDIASGIREALTRLELGTDLLAGHLDVGGETASCPAREREAGGTGPDPEMAMDETIWVIRRSLAGLLRICDDLEMAESEPHPDSRRICVMDSLLTRSVDAYARENPGALGMAIEGDDVHPIVLGHPWQLQEAFVRVLAEIHRRAESPGVPTITLETHDHDAVVVFEFACAGGPEHLPERYFGDGCQEDGGAPETRVRPSCGIRSAARIVSQHGGSISARTDELGMLHVRISLPLAPGSTAQEEPGDRSSPEAVAAEDGEPADE